MSIPSAARTYRHAQRISSAQTILTVATLTVAGFGFLFIPGSLEETSLGILDPAFSPLWLAGLIAGGIATAIGYFLGRLRLEVCGLLLLSASVASAALAVVDVRDVQAIPPALFYASLSLGLAGRILDLLNLARLRDRVAGENVDHDRRRPA